MDGGPVERSAAATMERRRGSAGYAVCACGGTPHARTCLISSPPEQLNCQSRRLLPLLTTRVPGPSLAERRMPPPGNTCDTRMR